MTAVVISNPNLSFLQRILSIKFPGSILRFSLGTNPSQAGNSSVAAITGSFPMTFFMQPGINASFPADGAGKGIDIVDPPTLPMVQHLYAWGVNVKGQNEGAFPDLYLNVPKLNSAFGGGSPFKCKINIFALKGTPGGPVTQFLVFWNNPEEVAQYGTIPFGTGPGQSLAGYPVAPSPPADNSIVQSLLIATLSSLNPNVISSGQIAAEAMCNILSADHFPFLPASSKGTLSDANDIAGLMNNDNILTFDGFTSTFGINNRFGNNSIQVGTTTIQIPDNNAFYTLTVNNYKFSASKGLTLAGTATKKQTGSNGDTIGPFTVAVTQTPNSVILS